jgi:selenide,water dikinase
LESPDDAAVYRISGDTAVISTVDFFPPVVDDPYLFGSIAAANALSDIYAMGGRPLMAINLAAYPDGLDLGVLSEILRGGAETVREAGAVIAGGHTIADKEPKYGLAVTGVVSTRDLLLKQGAREGDVLILTKPLGTGVITTALKNDAAQEAHISQVTAGMIRLNRNAADLAVSFNRISHSIHAMTDITGFGLIGHAHEMAHVSHVGFRFFASKFAWYDGALDYATLDFFPGGMSRNREYFSEWVTVDEGIPEQIVDLLFDPQTSGGLLIAIDPNRAEEFVSQLIVIGDPVNIVGEVIASPGKIVISA